MTKKEISQRSFFVRVVSRASLAFVALAGFAFMCNLSLADDLHLDQSGWLYNESDDAYYQLGVRYCAKPAEESLQTLAIFVPGRYMTGRANGDGSYTCEVKSDAAVGSFTSSTAPIAFSVDTPGYMPQYPLEEYASYKSYLDRGIVYVHAGCRGREQGAPAGVTDLKAAIRFLRHNKDLLPCDVARVFTFGMSGGGAQSALVGATGDSTLYDAYLEAIGAVMTESDAVYGSMCWCPITSLDTGNEAYEWFMGSTREGLSATDAALSKALAQTYPGYINRCEFKGPDGATLSLEQTIDGSWFAGSYYDYLKGVVEESLNNFLVDTPFPYDATKSNSMGGPGGPGGPRGPRGVAGGGLPAEMRDNIARKSNTGGLQLTGVYQSASDYIAALNQETEWVNYDATTGRATIKDLKSFVQQFKHATKGLAAFDQLDGKQGENTLFGYNDGAGAHFDGTILSVLKSDANLSSANSEVIAAFESDLAKTDAVGNVVATRLNAYSPLYYLLPCEAGYQSSTVAKHWRIRTGIRQSDTSITTEVNLALALKEFPGVESVDFATIWGQFHTKSERTGSSDENFIAWVCEILK